MFRRIHPVRLQTVAVAKEHIESNIDTLVCCKELNRFHEFSNTDPIHLAVASNNSERITSP